MHGYDGESLKFLESLKAEIGDTITTADISGVIMPRYKGGADKHIVLKLPNSYNVTVPISKLSGATIQKLSGATIQKQAPPKPPRSPSIYRNKELPDILFVSTGGTIASKVDYVTGAVTPILDIAGLLDMAPELVSIAHIDTNVVLTEHSENIQPHNWVEIANIIHKAVGQYAGIIVAHGTDTMQYTASFLSFALAGFPEPIVMVGSQRSPDRPSSDAAENLVAAARLIASGKARGVYVAMHGNESDGTVLCHRGTRVRKCHTSARGAFETIDGSPEFTISHKEVTRKDADAYYQNDTYESRIGIDENAALLKYHPGMSPKIIDSLVADSYRAIILEGTGLGHVSKSMYEAIERAVGKDVLVAMTSQCIAGAVNMNVYESGRKLQKLGVTPLGNMLAETALVKTMWALAQSDNVEEVRKILLRPIASEMSA